MTHFYLVEIGARGLPLRYKYTMLKELGLVRDMRKELLNGMSKEAINTSHFLWLNRKSEWPAS